MFFSDKEFLTMYLSKGDKERGKLHGATYCKKLSKFIELHFENGMKYLEFVKFDCIANLGKACKFCEENPWAGPPCSRVPRPMPDYEALRSCHYKPVSCTPTHTDDILRPIDDYQPRKQISDAFQKGDFTYRRGHHGQVL